MNSSLWCIFFLFLHSTSTSPQKNSFKMPNVDFSSAEEVNGLEPSPTPELASRSYNNNGNSLETTLEEVQNILKASPELPRLTKGEILDLIENITKQDMEKLRSLNNSRNGKSVLLVMPFSPKKNGESMEDLYTKAPITQLVENDNKTTDDKKENRKKKPSFNFKKENTRIFGRNITKMSYKLTFPTSEIPYDTTSPMTTEASNIEVTTYRRRVRPPRTRPPTSTRPTRRRRRPTFNPTTIETKPDFNSQTDKFLPENAIRVTRPPAYRFPRRTTTTTTTGVPDLNTAESYQEDVYVNPPVLRVPSSGLGHLISTFQQQDELTRDGPVFKPISNQLFRDDEEAITSSPPTTPKPLANSFIIPEGFEHIIRNLELDSNREKFLEGIKFPPKTTTTTTTPYPITPMPEFGEMADNLSPDMKNLLMTFGLIPNPEEKKERTVEIPIRSEGIQEHPESYTGFKPLPDDGTPNKDLDSLLASFGLGRSARKSKKIRKRVDLNPGLDLSVVPESMMGIINNLGLSNVIPVGEETIPVLTSKEDRIDDTYENEEVSAEDIEDINSLSRENPGKNTTVSPGENSTLAEDNSTTEQPLVNNPELLKMDEEDTTTIQPEENNTDDIRIETTTKGTSTSVVFNPTDQKIVEREKEQLDKLVELIKALKRINGSATEEDFKNFDLDTLREFTQVLNDSQRTTFGEQIENEINPINNFEDIPKFNPKRQESTTEEAAASETITESKIEPLFLEESFGKLAEEETETPTTKKYGSGVYYMIDWNTFLEVDNTKGTHVNLRFQPKVGDPGRFYSIKN